MLHVATMTAAVMGLVGAGATPDLPAPRDGGTISVTAITSTEAADPLTTVSVDAATTALGQRGFTILNDPAHAAYSAEVITSRTEVGTSVAKGRTGPALATGAGVNIPISRGKSILAPMLRTEVEIRIRRREDRTVLWHGAAMTVRSAAARDGGAGQVAFALSQAALSSYPIQTQTVISIP